MTDPDTERRVYRQALIRVLHTRTADAETLAAITPHLERTAVAELLSAHQAVALPGVAVDGAFWQLQPLESGEFHLRALRAPGSFDHPRPRHAKFQPPGAVAVTRHLDEALAYGREHWGQHLERDAYQSAACIELRDPSEPAGGGPVPAGGRLIAIVYGFLQVGGWEIVRRPMELRRSMFEQSLRRVTTNRDSGLERTASAPEQYYYCALCGSALALDRCLGCGRQFPRDTERLILTDIPMARIVYERLLGLGLDLPFEIPSL